MNGEEATLVLKATTCLRFAQSRTGLGKKIVPNTTPLRRAAGQSSPKNPNRSTHSRESKSAQVIGAFRKPLYGITFLTVQIDTPCQHGEARRGPCRR